MASKTGKAGIAALSLLGVAGAALAVGGGVMASYTLHGKRQTLEEALAWQKAHYDISWYEELETETYTVSCYDGYVLHAQLCKNPEPTGQYVILTHEYTDNRFGMLKYMKLYLDRGYNCVIYDLRGHGENESAVCTYSIREGKDLYEMIRDTRNRYPDLTRLGLHGESLGAASTVSVLGYGIWAQADGLAGRKREDASAAAGSTASETVASDAVTTDRTDRVRAESGKNEVPVDFAVADCGFADIENVLEGAAEQIIRNMKKPKAERDFSRAVDDGGGISRQAKLAVRLAGAAAKVRYGYSYAEMKPITHLADNHVPILFLHGADDTFIRPENSRRMAAATAGYSEYHLLPGAAHAESVLKQPEMYRRYLYGFLDRIEKPERTEITEEIEDTEETQE